MHHEIILLRSLIPKWEEIIVFNESFNYFTQEHPNILVMFEVTCIKLNC